MYKCVSSKRQVSASRICLAAAVGLLTSTMAYAGGYDTGERNWDFLFQQDKVAFEASGRYIDPRRRLNNVTNVFPNPLAVGPSSGITEASSFWVPNASLAARFGEHARCLASYRVPFAGFATYTAGWVGQFSALQQDFESRDYGLTCAGSIQAGKGKLSFIGGISYQQVEYFLTRNGGPLTGLSTTRVKDKGVAWRAGVAYEIPEYALRASLIYNSQVDYTMTGTQSFANVPGSIPISGSISMPQSIELKVQSGVAPGWLAFGSVLWTDWSVADGMFLCPTALPTCTAAGSVSGLTLLFKDTWTITVGAAHQFSDMFTLAGNITWDQGATQGFTSQTDTWLAGLTGVVTPSENVTLKFGGQVGVLTGGTLSTAFLQGGVPNPVGYTATFGDDLVYSLNASLTGKF